MATTFKVQPLLGDTPSDQVYLMYLQLNRLTAYVGLLTDAVAASVDYATLKSGIAAIDVTGFRVLRVVKSPPNPRQFATV